MHSDLHYMQREFNFAVLSVGNVFIDPLFGGISIENSLSMEVLCSQD